MVNQHPKIDGHYTYNFLPQNFTTPNIFHVLHFFLTLRHAKYSSLPRLQFALWL